MIGSRLRKANLIAKRRFRRKIWNVPEPGCLRKNNTTCSCEMCCNPRRSKWTPKTKKPTIQERRAKNGPNEIYQPYNATSFGNEPKF